MTHPRDLAPPLPSPASDEDHSGPGPGGPGASGLTDSHFQVMLEHAALGVSFGDRVGRFIWVNQAFADLVGHDREELIGMNFRDLTHPEDLPEQETVHARLWNREALHYNLEKRYRRKDGAYVHCLINVALITDPVSGQETFVSMYVDLTERRAMEQGLAESEARYRDLVRFSPDPIYVTQDGVLMFINPAGLKLFAAQSESELIGKSIFKLLHPDDRELALRRYQTVMDTDQPAPLARLRFLRLDGETVETESAGTKVRFQGREAVQTGLRDITSHVRAQRRLSLFHRISSVFATQTDDQIYHRTLDYLLHAFGCSLGFLGYLDKKGDLVFPSMTREIWDRCQVADKTIEFPREKWGGLWGRALLNRRMQVSEGPLNPPQGHLPLTRAMVAPLLHQDALVGVFGVANKEKPFDTEDRELAEATAGHLAPLLASLVAKRRHAEEAAQLEDQLRQSQRLEAVGTLAGGIAHDFNNILAAILGYCELATEELPEGHHARGHLRQAMSGCGRARDLVRQILSFSRPAEHQRRPLNLVPLIKESLKLIRSTVPASIAIDMDFQSGDHLVMGDPTQLQQVVMNLCTNAAQAMGERGVLSVTLDQVDLAQSEASAPPKLAPGAYARLKVRDSGGGMEPAVMSRIFEPFFTTRGRREGTGMGLAVAHGIVTGHGGAVWAESSPGRGSTFTVLLPLFSGPSISESEAPPREEAAGNERILFVDDEKALSDIAQRVLARLGYAVSPFHDSREALAHFQANPGAYDLVITDYTMPGMNGGELTARLLAIRPDLPVIIATGYSGAMTPERARELGARRLLMKPLISREVGQAIREVLDE